MWYLALNKQQFDRNPPWALLDNPVLAKHNPTLTADEEQNSVVLTFQPEPTPAEQTAVRLLFSEYTL